MEIITTLNTLNSLITAFRDIAILIILILGFRYLGKKISDFTKNIPYYLEKYEKIKFEERRVLWAKGVKI